MLLCLELNRRDLPPQLGSSVCFTERFSVVILWWSAVVREFDPTLCGLTVMRHLHRSLIRSFIQICVLLDVIGQENSRLR